MNWNITENDMPDLRSELEKVINAWEHPEQTQPETQPEPQPEPIMTTTPTQPTKSNAEKLFDCVKANPGWTSDRLCKATGVSFESGSSQLAQMVKRNLIRKEGGSYGRSYGGGFYAVLDRYMSPAEQLGVGKHHKMSKKKTKGKSKPAKVNTQLGMFTLDTSERKVPPAPKPELTVSSPPMRSVFDLDIESLTIAEARALRDKLNALFSA